jgi:hypothetical protein
MKSENARFAWGPRPDGFWNRLNNAISSRPMMTHSARFFVKLFTLDASSADPRRHGARLPAKRPASDPQHTLT